MSTASPGAFQAAIDAARDDLVRDIVDVVRDELTDAELRVLLDAVSEELEARQ